MFKSLKFFRKLHKSSSRTCCQKLKFATGKNLFSVLSVSLLLEETFSGISTQLKTVGGACFQNSAKNESF